MAELAEKHTIHVTKLENESQAAKKEAEKVQEQGKKAALVIELLQAHIQS